MRGRRGFPGRILAEVTWGVDGVQGTQHPVVPIHLGWLPVVGEVEGKVWVVGDASMPVRRMLWIRRCRAVQVDRLQRSWFQHHGIHGLILLCHFIGSVVDIKGWIAESCQIDLFCGCMFEGNVLNWGTWPQLFWAHKSRLQAQVFRLRYFFRYCNCKESFALVFCIGYINY